MKSGEPADVASRHAAHLVATLQRQLAVPVAAQPDVEPRTPVQDWAASGAMALTGRAQGPCLVPVGAPASAVRGAVQVLRRLEPDGRWDDLDVRLLGERAAVAGLRRRGPASVGGAFRLLPSADGWVGVNLPRPEDVDLLPALTFGRLVPSSDSWPALGEWLAGQDAAEVAARARLLGLPLVQVPVPGAPPDAQLEARWGSEEPPWVRLRAGGRRSGEGPADRARPLVLCLASLWAGPLAAHLLHRSGARVVTVESVRRPDGGRRGSVAFHDLLHAGKEMVALDLPEPAACAALQRLIRAADLVVDGSRPRAMRRLGIDVDEVVAEGTSWLSITGYGRQGPWAEQPAFGDDAAAAAGLVAWDASGPVPAGDAIADPLTGVHAAVAGLASLHDPRAWLIEMAMREVAIVASRLPGDGRPEEVSSIEPSARQPAGRARPLGADTTRVLTEFGIGS